MIRSSRCHAVVALALGAAVLLPQVSMSAPQTVAEIAGYQGADRQAVLEAGARKEGSVLIYTVGTQTDSMFKRFGEIYPFIRVEVFRGDNTELVRRAQEEYRAGRYTVDAFETNTAGLRLLKESNGLLPFHTPEMEKTRKDAIEPGRYWVNDYGSFLNFAYNTKLAPEAAGVTTYDDLLDPKFKGKMTISGWVSTTAYWVGAMVLTKGEDFVRRLGQQNFVVYEVSPRAIASLIVSGESPISPAIYSSHVNNDRAKGAPVAWKPLGAVYGQTGAVAVAAKAPHPHAAMLLIDVMLSKDGQVMRQELGYVTARTDLVNEGEQPKEVIYMADRPNFLQEFETWSALTARAFGKGKAPPK